MAATGLPAALSRSALLLEAVARGDGLLFHEAIVLLGTVPSTVSRLLHALTAADLLVHGQDGRYRSSPRLHRLAAAVSGAPDLAAEAEAAAQALAAATGESAAVFAPAAEGIRVVAKCELEERFRYRAVGYINRKCDSHGVCMLRAAWWDEATARRRLAEAAPAASATDWLRTLGTLRRQGWIANEVDDQPGIGRIAAALLDARAQPVLLIAITATSASVAARGGPLLGEVRAAAAALARRLGLPA